jgi:predicted ATPase/class 3 adenylate cyclase/DNA-binding CsgD family transcriptional regulator
MGFTMGGAQEAAALPTGTVTFLLTDIEGSTRGWEADRKQMATAVAHHHGLLEEAVARHRGVCPQEQGEGESLVAAFARPSDALGAALDAQVTLTTEEAGFSVRMAVHTGEAELRDAGNYFGPAIIRAARLRAVAHGGQILVSQASADVVADAVPAGMSLNDLGIHRLRDLSRPERIYQLSHPELARDFPRLRALDAIPNNLPTQLSSFVGREAELAELGRLLDRERLVTLTGVGGGGKTRLALQAAAERSDAYPDGTWWVGLGPLADPSLVPLIVSAALGLREDPSRTVTERLVEYLGEQRLLLVVDNCEHLLGATAELIDTLLRACASLSVLTTSRAPLGIDGETIWRVPPLSTPADGESLIGSDAVRLFVDRACKARPNFALSHDDRSAVAQICIRLDGIPLALELAAARTRVLSPAQMAAALDQRFRLLTSGRRAIARQQTLLASVEWSYALLTDEERVLFRRLAVFAGGFDLGAAESVCAGEGLNVFQILDLVTALVDKSIVVAGDGLHVRYHLLETLREFGTERLVEAAEADACRDRHLAYYLAFVDKLEEETTFAHRAALDQIDLERDNLRAALEWATASEARAGTALRLVTALTFPWQLRGRHQEGMAWFERALATAPLAPAPLRARALWGRAHLAWYANDPACAITAGHEALELARQLRDASLAARALNVVGVMTSLLDVDAGRSLFEESIALARESSDEWCLGDSLQSLAWTFIAEDEHGVARPLIDEAIAIGHRRGNRYSEAWHDFALSAAAFTASDFPAMVAAAEEGMAAASEVGEPLLHACCLAGAVIARTERGEVAEACVAMARWGEHLFRSKGWVAAEMLALANALIAAAKGNVVEARAAAEAALSGLRACGHRYGVAAAALYLGRIAFAAGDRPAAEAAYREGLEVARHLHHRSYVGFGEAGLAVIARANGDGEEAETRAHAALEPLAQRRIRWPITFVLQVLGEVAGDAESWAEAARLLAAAARLRDEIGLVPYPSERDRYEAEVARVQQSLGDEAFEGAWTEGTALSWEEAVAYTSRARGKRQRPSTGWGSLTPTELDVVRHATQGLTNVEIGKRLFMSAGTAKVHLSHIYAKLGVGGRAELAAEATGRGLGRVRGGAQ